MLSYKIKADYGTTEQRIFISNPTIRDALEKAGFKKTTWLGTITMRAEGKDLLISWFFPFRGYGKFFPIRSLRFNPRLYFEKTGTASLIEAIVLQQAKKKFPTIKWIYHDSPKYPRQRQLSKMGLSEAEIFGQISFEKYIALLRRKIAANAKKHIHGPVKRTQRRI